MIKLKILLVTVFICSAMAYASGQTTDEPDHHHEHTHDHRHEFGMANSPVYYVGEKVFTYGLHLHYVRRISESRFGVGLGYERIFDEHRHNTVSLVGSYRPIPNLALIASPGLTYEGSPDELRFAFHLETSYEFFFGDFHLGPAFEVAYDPEDYHISLGIHLGYGF